MFRHLEKFKIYNLTNSKNLSHISFTINRNNDLKLVRKIISKIDKHPILMKDILKLLKKEPELLEINKNHPFKRSHLKIK